MPKHVVRDDEVSTETYGKFYAEPFEGDMVAQWEIHCGVFCFLL